MDFLLALTTPLWSQFPFLTPELSFGIQTEMRSITPDNRIWNDNQTNSEVSCQAVNSVERDVNKSFVVLGSAFYYISMYLIWNIYHLPHATIPHATYTLQWRHNERDGIWNHWCHDGMLNRLFRCRSKKISKPRVTGVCVRGIYRWPVDSPHKGPIEWKMFPFDDIIMCYFELCCNHCCFHVGWGNISTQ